jgi:hypothetical protein
MAEYNLVLIDAMMGVISRKDLFHVLVADIPSQTWNVVLTCLGLPQFSQLSLHTRRVLLKVGYYFNTLLVRKQYGKK